jgi:hypothetical protein
MFENYKCIFSLLNAVSQHTVAYHLFVPVSYYPSRMQLAFLKPLTVLKVKISSASLLYACCLHHGGFLLELLFDPEDRYGMFSRNID